MNPISKALVVLLAALCGLAGSALPAAAVVSAGQDEYAVKAQLLVELAAYVKWPGAPRQGRPFTIAVIGASSFGRYLNDYAARHTGQGRPIEVQYWNAPRPGGSCDMAFICQSERAWAGEILDWAGGRGVLTVCESAKLAEAGMMVALVLDGGRVKILINRQAMTGQGFSASSQLLGNAQLVGPAPGH